jgi:O-antigen/teichoic acid export membrane protein
MRLRLMPDRGVPGGPADGWRSLEAGFVAVGLVGVTMATFGPLFSIEVAYGLLTVSFIAAVFSLSWADRVAHSATAQRNVRRDARRGRILSGLALLLLLYYTGAWIFLIEFLPAVLFVGLIVWSLHQKRVAHSGAASEAET